MGWFVTAPRSNAALVTLPQRSCRGRAPHRRRHRRSRTRPIEPTSSDDPHPPFPRRRQPRLPARWCSPTVVGLWLTPFLLGRIGTHDYGLWLITTQILGYLMLLDLGVVALAPRETAYATGRAIGGAATMTPAPPSRGSAASSGWQVLPAAAVACALAWWVVAARWPELRYAARDHPRRVPGRLSAPALSTRRCRGCRTFLSRQGAARRVDQPGRSSRSSLVLADVGLAALAAGWVVTQAVIASPAVRSACGDAFPAIWHARTPRPSLSEVRELFGRSGWVSLTQIGQVFLNGSDVLVLGAILGPAATVPYACTGKLITVLANHPQLLMQAAAPAIAEMRNLGPRARARARGDGADARDADPERRGRLLRPGGQPDVRGLVGRRRTSSPVRTLTLLLLAAMLGAALRDHDDLRAVLVRP